MAKAVILYNHKNENHVILLRGFLSSEMHHITFTAIDMSSYGMLHEKYYEIVKAAPDFIVTFDLAGMELRTEMETATLNQIPLRMAHILLGNMEEYRQWLGERLNFSMFFYGKARLCKEIETEYPDIVNVRELPSCVEISEGKEFVTSFLNDFLTEAELLLTE